MLVLDFEILDSRSSVEMKLKYLIIDMNILN